jgi:hypothetical protein
MTKQDAEKLGWKFSQCETTIEKGHEIYMLPNKETALAVIAKRETNVSMGIVRKD